MERRGSLMVVAMLLVSFSAICGSCYGADIFVPSYVYPCSGTSGCAWDVFKNGATLVIINPNSGPGSSCNSDYTSLVNTVKTGSSTVKTVLGYVSTSYGSRAASLVQADINKYYSCYNIDGIFLDEGPTTCNSATLTQYQDYDTLVKSKGGLGYTVLNWGTNGPECYLTSTSINSYVTFEDYFSNYASSGAPLSYMASYDSSKFWTILHAAPVNATAVQAAVALAKTRNVGHIYITDDVLPNPFDTAPSTTVWETEKAAAGNVQDIFAVSYVYPCSGTPSCAWDVFENGSTLVVINPSSGPGTSCNSDYANLVNNIVKSGSSTVKIVLGYVATGYGSRSSSDVITDINQYYSCYNMDGIFLDEANTTCDSTVLANYKTYDSTVKGKGGLGYTVLNWGTNGPECYLKNTTIDSYVTFEEYFVNYTKTAAQPLPYMKSYSATKFWNILHTAPANATAVQAAVALSKTRNVGHVYITDDTLPNPYDTAPSSSVWQAEKAAAASPS